MRGGLAELPDFLRLGKRAARTITANVLFALAFSFSMIALAALGILSPAGGAIAHQAGTLIVLANSASLAGRAFVDLPGGRFGRHGPGSCPAADGL